MNIYDTLQQYKYINVNKTIDGKTTTENIIESIDGKPTETIIETINEPIIEPIIDKQVTFNKQLEIREYNNKFDEVQNILYYCDDDDITNIKTCLIASHSFELQGFKELIRLKRLKKGDLLYIKYIHINGKLGNGGYFVEYDDYNISLMDNYKIFKIAFDKHYFFYQKII